MGVDFTISSDPEVFIRDKDWIVKSFIPYTKGTKEAPEILSTGGGLQSDGVACEIALPICKGVRDFVRKINMNFAQVKKRLPKGYSLSFRSAAFFDKEELKDPRANEMGCMPDHDAWKLKMNNKPSKFINTMRTCGGHIHLSIPKEWLYQDRSVRIKIIKLLDIYLGIPSITIDISVDAARRRVLYGKAGAFRSKIYGVEYRTLSNFWLKDNNLMEWVYYGAESALDTYKAGLADNLIALLPDTPQIINDNLIGRAEEILEEVIPEFCNKAYLTSLSAYKEGHYVI